MSETDRPKPDATDPQPNRGRRALLKGAAWSAPAIITLTSGNAWAASMTCYERHGGKPVITETQKKEFVDRYSFGCFISGGPTTVLPG